MPGERWSVVPHYYFHVYDEAVCLDNVGQLLPDYAAASETAFSGARELACDELMRGELVLSHRIDVADERGDIIASVTYGQAAGVARAAPDAKSQSTDRETE